VRLQLGDSLKIIRRLLIYKIIEPVGKEQMGVTAPRHRRYRLGIISGEVVARYLRVEPATDIALIFVGECQAVIFAVACDEHLASVLGSNNGGTGRVGSGDNAQILYAVDVCLTNFGVP